MHCLISSFYIKPQLAVNVVFEGTNCLISSFYIKPQQCRSRPMIRCIVLYRLSTSNHNGCLYATDALTLSYIVFLHQTTTHRHPMHHGAELSYIVFLHQTTTTICAASSGVLLSYIVFLHQTTTER